MKLDLNEVVFVHKAITNQDIKGAEAPFVTIILNKLVKEAEKLQKEQEKK